MVDYTDTARDWALSRSDLIFLPVGSLEQHGDHLPINSDCRIAEYFSRKLADHFQAAMLPVLPIASCLEHTGWRGAFTLKPETLMNVIRDIAENAEMQNYRVMVVITGHGGNFPLGPACREWNRRDRKLKLILLHPYEYGAPLFTSGRMDMHAGEYETSLLRYICGEPFEFTGDYPTGNVSGDLVQSDLNTFGVGCLNPHGIPGHPEDASLELGQKLAELMESRCISLLESRLARLAKNPRYSGSGALYLRKCVAGDLDELQALSESVNWNQLPGDWRNFLASGGVWSMIHLNRIVAAAAWLPRGNGAVWIGLVITKPEWRGCGIATSLMQQILAETGHYPRRMLDASDMGAPVYRKLGFLEAGRIHRLELSGAYTRPALLQWSPLTEQDLRAIGTEIADDLIGTLRQNAPELAWIGRKNGQIKAWFTGRYGLRTTHFGPLYADSAEAALDAVSQMRVAADGRPVSLDVAGWHWDDFGAVLLENGAARKRDFLRMYHGDPAPAADPGCFAAAGPEYG